MTTKHERDLQHDAFVTDVSTALLDDAVDALVALAAGRPWDKRLYESVRQEAIELVMGTARDTAGLNRAGIGKLVDAASTVMFEAARNTNIKIAHATREAELMGFMCDEYARSVGEGYQGEDGELWGFFDEAQMRKLDAALIEYDSLRKRDDATDFMEEPEQVAQIIALLRRIRDETKPHLQQAERERQEQARAERIAARRKPDVVMETRLCATCGKKPARVDDLCKRCAHAAGTLPHGKIGEG